MTSYLSYTYGEAFFAFLLLIAALMSLLVVCHYCKHDAQKDAAVLPAPVVNVPLSSSSAWPLSPSRQSSDTFFNDESTGGNSNGPLFYTQLSVIIDANTEAPPSYEYEPPTYSDLFGAQPMTFADTSSQPIASDDTSAPPYSQQVRRLLSSTSASSAPIASEGQGHVIWMTSSADNDVFNSDDRIYRNLV